MYKFKTSWQSKILNCFLRLFIKPQFVQFSNETALPRLTNLILRKRKKMEKYALSLPEDAYISVVNTDTISGRWIYAKSVTPQIIMLYLHGGGYAFGSSSTHAYLGYLLAKACKAKVFLLDYRLAPEHTFPCALEDAVAAYRWLRNADNGSTKIILAGDSAGGGLVLSTVVYLRDHHQPLPVAAICLSPWTDLALTGGTITENQHSDAYLVIPKQLRYLGNVDVCHPHLSPLYADLQNLPPLYIQASSTEILLDDSRRLAEKARQANVPVQLDIWEKMPHCWHLFAKFLPEGQEAIKRIGDFVTQLH